MTIEQQKLNCLVHIQAFETWWAYYSLSDGQLYEEECREEASNIISTLETVKQVEQHIVQRIYDTSPAEPKFIDDLCQQLMSFGQDKASWRYPDIPSKSHGMLFSALQALKAILMKDLRIKPWPIITTNLQEYIHSARSVRWSPHLSRRILRAGDPDHIMRVASQSPTIVVVGDIRRSQELMTYAKDSKDFAERMVKFLAFTRSSIEQHNGIFDKFTGDGFVAYFNESTSSVLSSSHIEDFLSFIRDELLITSGLFAEWILTVRKRPAQAVGLAIGADIGIVDFRDIDNHLIVVGDAIVWATRMSSGANAGDVVVNNMLYAVLNDRADVRLELHIGSTKSGEEYQAYRLHR